jgi:branched-chain amino acid transport system permease protein
MAEPLQVITTIDALSWGIMLVLISVGLTLVFGFLNVVNFAHGAFYMLGGYLVFATTSTIGNFWIAIIIATFAVALLAMVVERVLLQPSYEAGAITQVLITIGVSFIIESIIVIVWGSGSITMDSPELFAFTVDIFGSKYPAYRLAQMVFGSILIGLIWSFIRFTETGLIIRASLTDKEMAQAFGSNISRLYAIVFGLGAGTAALAAGLLMPIRGVSPGTSTSVLLLAFVVIIVGGLGSFRGTVIAGISLGMFDIFATQYISPRLSGLTIFAVLVIVLAIRPEGLFGEEGVFE